METTNARYKRALQEIAAGGANPQAIAAEALKSHRQPPNYEWRAKVEATRKRAQARRDERAMRAVKAYRDWLDKGRPPIADYAKAHGIPRSSMDRLLEAAERALKLPYRQQRLHWGMRNRNYDTYEEIFKAKYPGETEEGTEDAAT